MKTIFEFIWGILIFCAIADIVGEVTKIRKILEKKK